MVKDNYNADIVGCSVPASEHSTVTSWDHELDSYINILDSYPDHIIISCVSDSYDIFNACHLVGQKLKDKITERNMTYVIRPDSGEPVSVILKCLDILKQYFPTEINSKGFEYFNNIKILWGDGITLEQIDAIYSALHFAGYSSDIMVFGAGGYLLQQLDRDTLKFAMKCSAICVSGQWRDVFKDPITDKGKTSKKGRVRLFKNNDYFTGKSMQPELRTEVLRTVFKNGQLLINDDFETIRTRTKEKL